jgi:hypothetical protein
MLVFLSRCRATPCGPSFFVNMAALPQSVFGWDDRPPNHEL